MDSPKSASFNARSSALVPLAIAVAALYVGREILLPFALAILISFLLAPLVERLEKWKVGRVPSVIAVVSLAFLTMAALAYIVALQAYDLAYNLPEYKGNIVQKARSFQGSEEGVWQRASNALDEVRADLTNQPPTDDDDKDPSTPSAPAPLSRTLDSQSTSSDVLPGRPPVPVEVIETLSAQEIAQSILGPIVSPLGAAAMVMIFVVFMLLEREDLRNRLIHLVGAKQLNLTTQAMDDAAHRVSRYLLMQLIINVAYGLVIAVGLFLIGLPNAFLWGALTAVLRFIPYVGPWIAAVMPLTLSLAVFDGWSRPTMVLALFVANELVSNNVLEPWLYGSSTGISTIGILASAVFWSWLWGPLGLVMATPLTVCLTVVGRYVPQLRFLNTLISDDEILPPQARFYQRLLAMDPEEATEVAEDYFNDHTLEELYDSVLLPALSLAEQDRHRGELDEVKQRFVHRTTREIVEDMGVRSQAASTADVPSPPLRLQTVRLSFACPHATKLMRLSA